MFINHNFSYTTETETPESKLLLLVSILNNEGKIDSSEYKEICSRISNHDTYCLGALEAFCVDHDFEEFHETILRIFTINPPVVKPDPIRWQTTSSVASVEQPLNSSFDDFDSYKDYLQKGSSLSFTNTFEPFEDITGKFDSNGNFKINDSINCDDCGQIGHLDQNCSQNSVFRAKKKPITNKVTKKKVVMKKAAPMKKKVAMKKTATKKTAIKKTAIKKSLIRFDSDSSSEDSDSDSEEINNNFSSFGKQKSSPGKKVVMKKAAPMKKKATKKTAPMKKTATKKTAIKKSVIQFDSDSSSEDSDSDSDSEEINNNFFFGEKTVKSTTQKDMSNLIIFEATVGPSISSEKIAAFDMDTTLITTQSGRTFPTSRTDWKWLYPEVPTKLKQLKNDGYQIVIFTNQKGISKEGKAKADEITGKIQDIATQLGFTILAFIACGSDHWRKPSPAMWEHLKSTNQVEIRDDKSFYIGDAAGRAANGSRKKDFSCDDRKFGSNCQLDFHTPEEFFLNSPKEKFDWKSQNPIEILKKYENSDPNFSIKNIKNVYTKNQEMILMVGPPASGKSTFVKTHLIPYGYEWINQDTLKTKQKCINVAREKVAQGLSVVIDNTNPAPQTRSEYIRIANQYNIPVRCYIMETPVEIAHHMNWYREKIGGASHVPDIAYNVFKSQFESVSTNENISEIHSIPFSLNFGNDEEKRNLFLQWT